MTGNNAIHAQHRANGVLTELLPQLICGGMPEVGTLAKRGNYSYDNFLK